MRVTIGNTEYIADDNSVVVDRDELGRMARETREARENLAAIAGILKRSDWKFFKSQLLALAGEIEAVEVDASAIGGNGGESRRNPS